MLRISLFNDKHKKDYSCKKELIVEGENDDNPIYDFGQKTQQSFFESNDGNDNIE